MEKIAIQPMIWSNEPDIADVQPISDVDAVVLRDLRDVLVRHNAIDRFGINLLHKHFAVLEGERLVEETDAATRTMTLRPTMSWDEQRSITTSWRFAATADSAVAELRCVTECPYGPGSIHQGVRHTGRRE